MAKVWIVEQGEYSDYHVVGVFSSRENADLIAERMNESPRGNAAVVERELDPGVDALHQGLQRYDVLMHRDGTTEEVTLVSTERTIRSVETEFELWYRSRTSLSHDVLDATVWAKDEQHAVKIVNEKRVQLIASNEWLAEPEPSQT